MGNRGKPIGKVKAAGAAVVAAPVADAFVWVIGKIIGKGK